MAHIENGETANETSTPNVIYHSLQLFKNHAVTITITEEPHPNASNELNDVIADLADIFNANKLHKAEGE